MRKGRSSRRGRVSRPLIGMRAPSDAPLSTDDDVPSSVGPNVVVSLPPSEPPASAEADGLPSVAPTTLSSASLGDTIIDAPVTVEEERKRDFASTMVFGSFGTLEDDRRSRPPKALASTMMFGSEVPEQVAAILPVGPVRVEEAPLPTPKALAIAAAFPIVPDLPAMPASTKLDAAKPSVDPDEISVPPIGDVVSERFFSEGTRPPPAHVDTDESLTVPDRAARLSHPIVIQRRERFGRYVKWAVAGAAVLCLAAVGQAALVAKTPATAARAPLAIEPTPEPKAAAPVAAKESEPAPVKVETPEPAAPAVETKPAEAPSASAEPKAAGEPPSDPKADKRAAQRFLERGKLADAIAAGERSVTADPSDGEAWLILGASYQEKGDMVQARRAYGSCVKEATSGPRAECAKMLR